MTQTVASPLWAVLTTWGIVNAINVLQAAGFISRIPTRSLAINHILGFVIMALIFPAVIALVGFIREQAAWQQWTGLVVFITFIAFMVAVEYVKPVEFRSPKRYGILVPYLLLFFGSIFVMGIPMFKMNRKLWLVTVVTTVLLLVSMGAAMRKGVG